MAKPLIIQNRVFCNDFDFFKDPKKLSLFEASQLNGEGFLFFKMDNSPTYGIVSDYFSFATLFYSIVNVNGHNELLISSSFRGVQEELRKISPAKASDVFWEVATPHLASSHNLFRTRASHKTFSRNILTLNQDEIILFSKYKVEIKKRPYVCRLESSYNDHIDKGIENAISDIKSYCALGLPINLSLSGGKDSRMLLALLNSAGSDCQKLINVTTADPRNLKPGPSKDILIKDFNIAAKLVKNYGLRWSGAEPLCNEEMDFNESISRWQNFRSNNSFELTNSFNLSGPLERQNIYMAGIGGELVRSYIGAENRKKYPKWWETSGKCSNSKARDLSSFFNIVCPKGGLTDELYTRAQKEFIDSFCFPHAEDVIECLDLSYMNFRSRAHAGVGAYNYATNKITSYPICQHDFLHASKLLDREDQEDGRIIFDVMRKLDPNLLDLEFASPPWPSRFFNEHASSLWDSVNSESAVRDFYKKDKLKQVTPRRVIEKNGLNFHQKAFERTVKNIELIIEKMSSDGVAYGDLDKRMVKGIYLSDKTLLSMLGVTESIADVIRPADNVNLIVHNLCLQREDWRKFKSNSSVSTLLVARENDDSAANLSKLISYYDLTKVDAELLVNNSNPSNSPLLAIKNLPDHVDVAVYWYLNGEKVSFDWYEHKHTFSTESFHSATNKDDIRATIFLRIKDESEAARVFHVSAKYL